MRPRKSILGFFLALTVVYGLLIAPWPNLDKAYLVGFRAVGRTLFSEFGSNGRVTFTTEAQPMGRWFCAVILANWKHEVWIKHDYDTRYDYLATVLTLALVSATPIPWSRKWKAVLAAMFLIHIFLVGRLFWGILYGFTDDKLAVIPLSHFWKQALFLGVLISSESTFVVPIFIWILVSFRAGDWQRLVVLTGTHTPETPDAKARVCSSHSGNPRRKHATGGTRKPN
jgi:hypothetical protein